MIQIILELAVLLAVIIIAILNWDRIIDWFQGRTELKQSDKDNIAFTLQQKLKNGKYKTIEGIFNKRTNKLPDGVVYESKEIDEKLAEAHRKEELVIYE